MSKNAYHHLKDLLGSDYYDAIEDRITYAYDGSGLKHLPDAVLMPRTVDHVSEILRTAGRYGVPVTPRGAGSGLTGGAVPPAGGLVLTMDHFNRIIQIDTENFLAVVEPAVVTADLHAAVENVGLFYPPDPASMYFSTIGGNIAEGAGGMRAVKYGTTRDWVMGLEVVLASGDVIHTGSKCIKDVVGYDLTRLFVGSEGTLGVITRAIVKLIPNPEAIKTLLAVFGSMDAASRAVPDIFQHGLTPRTLEFMDKRVIRAVNRVVDSGIASDAEAVLLIEVDGPCEAVEIGIEEVARVCRANQALEVLVARDEKERERLWKSRRSIHSALEALPFKWAEEDVSVPRSSVATMVAAIEDIGRKWDMEIACFGHFGDGNIHVNLSPRGDRDKAQRLYAARQELYENVSSLEGRIAAEHGIGLVKKEDVRWNIDEPTLNLMAGIKKLLDPAGILNPGKVFPNGMRDQ
jgi:glycolate oxidase